MIILYVGTPGSGMSLHCAHEIREDLRFKKNVISTCYIDTRFCFMTKLQELIFNISKGKIHRFALGLVIRRGGRSLKRWRDRE